VQKWFVIQTHARAELRAQANLSRQAFTSFLPRFRRTKRGARRDEQILVPVFPGYLFVKFDPDRDQWRVINSTFGVRRLVSFSSERPQPMPEPAMDALLARCDEQLITRPLPQFAKGDEVRLMTGALANTIGRIEDFDDKGRVDVLLELLGRVMRVKVKADMLGPVTC